MSVTITITDPTVQEANALRTYLDALTGSAAGVMRSDPENGPGASIDLVKGTFTADIEVPIVSAEDAGAPDFDSAGMPWDERIHASSRATVADGTWRKKRGVSDELVAEVEAELKQDPAVLDAPEVPEAPVGESKTAGIVTEVVGSTATETSAPVVAEPPAPDAPPPPPAATANPFLAVMSRIGKSGMTKEQKDELLTAAGALDDKGNPSILVLNKKPELIAGFVALLDDAGV